MSFKGENVTSEFRNRAPAAMAVIGDVIEKLLVFFRRPKAFSQLLFVTTRMSTHLVDLKLQCCAKEE